MPFKNGLELVEEILNYNKLKNYNEIKILILTSDITHKTKKFANQKGIYIKEKPIN